MEKLNKPFVALLCALAVLATVNIVAANPARIAEVLVTNWPMNQNVTVRAPLPLSMVLAEDAAIQGTNPFLQWSQFYSCQRDTYQLAIPERYTSVYLHVQKKDAFDPTLPVAGDISFDFPIAWLVWQNGNVLTIAEGSIVILNPPPWVIGQVLPHGFASANLPVKGPTALLYVSNCYPQPQVYSLAVYLTA